MGFLNVLGKLGDVIMKPIDLMVDWGKEPLKNREHKRDLERESNSVNTKARIEKEKIELESKLKQQEKELDTDLAIKKQTEVHRILSEIDELQKDKDFQRMKLVSESIMKYQEELTKLNVNAINAIGNMQLELREKAQNLVYNKTVKYKELQDKAINEASDDLEKILEKFPDNERVQDIMIKAVDKRLSVPSKKVWVIKN